jgi:hypothetical protein
MGGIRKDIHMEKVTVFKLARIAGVATQTVYNAIYAGKLKKGEDGTIDEDEAKAWIANREAEKAPKRAGGDETKDEPALALTTKPPTAIALPSATVVISAADVPVAVLDELDADAREQQLDKIVQVIVAETVLLEHSADNIGMALFRGILGKDRDRVGNRGNRGNSVRSVAERADRPGWSEKTLNRYLRAHVARIELKLTLSDAAMLGGGTMSWLFGASEEDRSAAVLAVAGGDEPKISELKRQARLPSKPDELDTVADSVGPTAPDAIKDASVDGPAGDPPKLIGLDQHAASSSGESANVANSGGGMAAPGATQESDADVTEDGEPDDATSAKPNESNQENPVSEAQTEPAKVPKPKKIVETDRDEVADRARLEFIAQLLADAHRVGFPSLGHIVSIQIRHWGPQVVAECAAEASADIAKEAAPSTRQ